jgi:NADP-dependent 3-hydroxy acid dehydrogenase YdfG
VITGASSGIGEATARLMAAEGAKLSLVARRHDRLVALADEIEKDGGEALPIEADVSDHGAVEAVMAQTKGQFGGVHVLVNNAGLMLLGPVDGGDVEEWRRMLDVNVLGLLYCTREAIPIMRDSGGGHIVNISSVAGRQANLGSAVYNVTKWGVTGFSEALRQEALHSNIRVTCVEPGYVDTELQGHNEHPAVLEAMEKMKKEIGDLLEAEDIARAIVFAVSQPDRVNVNEVLVRPTGQRR